jgi:outer membrane protein TolC
VCLPASQPTRLRGALVFLTGLLAAAVSASAQEVTPSAPPASIAVPTLTVEEAIARALQHNQRIKVSDFGRGVGRANVLAAYGNFDPAVTFRRSYSESESAFLTNLNSAPLAKADNYSLALEGLTPWGLTYQIGGTAQNQRTSITPSNNFVTFGGISVTQPLLRGFGFGANLAALHIAKADRAISDWEYRQTVIDTVTGVVVAYNDLVEAREVLRIARRSHDLAAQLVRDNERRNRVGSISDADVTQARARAANREELILFAARNVKATENRLRELMGDTAGIMPSGADIAVTALVPMDVPTPDGATELRRALELRPDYQAAKQGIVKRRANRSYARNQLLPRVDFVGSFGYNGLDPNFAESRAQVRNEDNRAYSLGVVVSVPLTFAEGRGKARAAKLALQQSEADLERLQQDIAVSVANAIGQLETTSERVKATTRAYELAAQALEAEEKRFRAGTSSTFFVLQLQEQLAAVESNKVQAIADQHRALAQYEREIGATLLSRHLNVQ